MQWLASMFIRRMSMKTFRAFSFYRGQAAAGQRGVTLIELLVGMVMSLVAIVAIYQIITVWDGRRRTLTAGSNAQISGNIGGLEIERDLQLAGMGFGNVLKETIGCTVQARNSDFATPDYTFRLLPIEIVNNAANGPDTIRVLYGNSAYANSVQKLKSSTANSKTLQNRAGYNAGDLVVVAGNSPRDCILLEVTGRSATADTVDHVSTNYVSYYTGTTTVPKINPSPGSASFSEGEAYNLGPGAQRTVWSVNTATTVLSRANSLRESAAFEVTEGIVNLQAQYGVDGSDGSAPDGLISAAEWTATTPAAADWYKVLAVRVALLSRSNQYEKDSEVTPTAPTWFGNSFTMLNLDGTTATTTGVNDWRRYRYRVYESVIPLRNMLWGAAL
jgi:type IV pilus assembly protein PilW